MSTTAGSPHSAVQRRLAAAGGATATNLDLSGLRLSGLPDWLGDISTLTTLDLSVNELGGLPKSVSKLTGLTILDLSDNNLVSLPDWLINLTALTTLKLGGNQLQRLPDWLGGLTALTTLDLGYNNLSATPNAVRHLTNLTTLTLAGNQLQTLPDWLGRLTAITTLDVGQCLLTALPDTLGNFAALTSLDLRDNQLETLPDTLGHLASLAMLRLAGNPLKTLPDWLGRLTAITTLDVGHCLLTTLPDTLGNLTSLSTLDARDNQLDTLPDALGDLTALLSLGISGNPLSSLPPEVIAQGDDAVLTFLRAGGTESERQWTSKVLVVGEGRVGKTSLVRVISGQAHDPAQATTHGMLVRELPLPHPSQTGITMALSVWDFGGQDIYHATHQFFLTDRSLYLLTWNAEQGTERSRLRYWLDIISARTPTAPILVVATHTASRPADIDIDRYKRDYPAIAGYFEVDSATSAGIDELVKMIRKVAAGLPLMGVRWPRTWGQAAAALAAPECAPYMDVNEMWATLADCGVSDPAERQTLAIALHHRGQLLYFPDDKELADTVICDPQWLNTRIAQILESNSVRSRSGRLTRADLTATWRDLPGLHREHLLTMMDRFDVSYRIRDSNDDTLSMVVTWLPHSPPDYTARWDACAGSQIRIIYKLPVQDMPPGIPGWFLARSHRFTTGIVWRTGALLAHPDGLHLGLVKVDGDQIELAVRGPLPAAFFAVLDDGLNMTLDRYPGLPITRLVPCHTHGDCTHRFDYAKISRRLAHGGHTVMCPELEGPVNIAQLLFGIVMTSRELITHDLHQLITDGFGAVRRDLADAASTSQRDAMQTRTLIQAYQHAHCPSVFTFTRSGKRLFKSKYVLRLYCEEPGSWHPLPDDEGCYEIVELDGWLRIAAPYFGHTLDILRATIPLIGPILGITARELRDQVADDLDLTHQILDSAARLLGAPSQQHPVEVIASPRRNAVTDADYRVLRAYLSRLDPTTRWGGLDPVLTPEHVHLYLCPEHAAAYK